MTARPDPQLSLVLATYGRADVLGTLVASLVAQTFHDFELLVADQNPDDRVLPYLAPLEAAGLAVRRLRLAVPNLSAARNAAIGIARGRFLAFPDDDCWYQPETLAAAQRRLAAEATLDGLVARWAEAPHETGDDAPLVTTAAMRRFRGGNVASITLFLEAEAVRRAGGFDERIGVGRWYGAGEETDLVLSLLARGAHLAHAPEVVVHHPADSSDAAAPLAKMLVDARRRGRGAGALYAKHRLPGWVIARGLIAPLAAPPGPRLAAGLATSIGRLEGLVCWRREERRAGARQRAGSSAGDANERR